MSGVSGQELLEIADSCWNSRRGEYHGGFFNGYNMSVNLAMKQEVKENGKQGKKRKARRAEAVKIVNGVFDHARHQEVARLSLISSEATSPLSSGTKGQDSEMGELEKFASEVMDSISQDDVATSSGLAGMIDISFIITLITTIINAIKECKKPAPVPDA